MKFLPYDDYLEFLPGDQRAKEIKRIGGRIADPDRQGEHAKYMDGGFAIPICLGDYYGPFRVVGTTPDFFEKLRYGRSSDQEYKFSEGRNFVDHSPEHGFFEAVLGSQVAATMNKKVGDTLQTTHGDPEGQGHGEAFTIVGILAPTGTPNDRAAFINIEGFYKMDNHARAFVDPAHPDNLKVDVAKEPADAPDRLPLEKRDVVAVLVKPANGSYAVFLERPINKTMRMQAVSPISEISGMLAMFVAPVKNALLGLTVVVCVVSAISILVSIYNSMSDRRRDIAVMRALGARRDVVLLVVLLESLLIACIGGAVGWFAGHGIGVACADLVEERTGLQIGFFNTITVYELTLIPGLSRLSCSPRWQALSRQGFRGLSSQNTDTRHGFHWFEKSRRVMNFCLTIKPTGWREPGLCLGTQQDLQALPVLIKSCSTRPIVTEYFGCAVPYATRAPPLLNHWFDLIH